MKSRRSFAGAGIALPIVLLAGCGGSSSGAQGVPALGHAQVAYLPQHQGLQYCVNLRPSDLAPRGATHVYVHSLSAFLTSKDPNEPALMALQGRYPGWDTPGTTIYNQQFTNTNTVWLEIIHEFPLGIACMEAYGPNLLPSRYAKFNYQMLVNYTYLPPHGPGANLTKLFPITWGTFLPRYAPAHRPKH